MKLEKVYSLWYEQYRLNVRPSTAYQVDRMCQNHILSELGAIEISSIGCRKLQQLVNSWFMNTRRYRLRVYYLKSIFEFAVSRKHIRQNPLEMVDIPKMKTWELENFENYFNKEELLLFLSVVKHVKWSAMFRVLAFTGIRQGELLALTWEDVNFSKNTIRINKTVAWSEGLYISAPKTKQALRDISLDCETIELLRLWKREQENSFKERKILLTEKQLIFPTEKENKLMFVQAIRVMMHRFLKETNLKKITPHGLRHTHCSLLLEAGVPIEVVAKRMGHANVQTTLNIYAHVTSKRDVEAVDLLSKYMKK